MTRGTISGNKLVCYAVSLTEMLAIILHYVLVTLYWKYKIGKLS